MVGVPEMTPVPALRVSPAGNVPFVTDQLYGGVPPVAASVSPYGWPTTPTPSEVVVTESRPGRLHR